MFDLNTAIEFSHTHCIAICALLVPANLLATLQTLILRGWGRSETYVRVAVGIASFLALVMVVHVLTWLAVGVIMAPTYILLSLGSTCLLINLWAIAHSASMTRLIRTLVLAFT